MVGSWSLTNSRKNTIRKAGGKSGKCRTNVFETQTMCENSGHYEKITIHNSNPKKTAGIGGSGDSHTFEQADKIRLGRLLERLHRGALEAEVVFDLVGDLPH